MDSPEVDQLEKVTSEIEYLFQEGVVFTPDQVERIKSSAELLLNLMDDSFLIVRNP